MKRLREETIKRFASSALLAAPVTAAVLLLMTYLILPGESDPEVTQMIANIQLLRTVRPQDTRKLPVFKAPPRPERTPLTAETVTVDIDSTSTEVKVPVPVQETEQRKFRDWQQAISVLIDESSEDDLNRWLIEQGHEDYVSIMQGPLPITNSVEERLSPTQEDITGYMNTYGDMEIKVSENCVATTQVAARFDQSDFGKHLPMRITCSSPPKIKLDFERD